MPEYIETVIRSILLIAGLFVITRILGKKQLSKLSFFEYIVGITVGDIAGTLSMDVDLDLTNGITSIIIWTSVPFFVSILSLKSKAFRDFVEGTPTTFIEKGNIIEAALRKEKYSADEILEQLRKKNVFRVADVEFASLDSNGDLSVLLKKAKQPLVHEDLFTEHTPILDSQAVIMDGKIDDGALRKTGFSREWLKEKLDEHGYNIDQVFLGQLDKDGHFTYDLFDEFLRK
jgi:uncharacterized membrane protein YcaP (DUF421 family)